MKNAMNLINNLYDNPNDVYIRGYKIEGEEIVGFCSIPSNRRYSHFIWYVTKEHYTRCISQLSYILVSHLLLTKSGRISEILSFENFERLMFAGKLYYGKDELDYQKLLPADKPFEISLKLGKVGKKMGLALCRIQVTGPVIGTTEFVADFRP